MDIQANTVNTTSLRVGTTSHYKQPDINSMTFASSEFPVNPFVNAKNFTITGPSSYQYVNHITPLNPFDGVSTLTEVECADLQIIRNGNVCTVVGTLYFTANAPGNTAHYKVPLAYRASTKVNPGLIYFVGSCTCTVFYAPLRAPVFTAEAYIRPGEDYITFYITTPFPNAAPYVYPERNCELDFTIIYPCD